MSQEPDFPPGGEHCANRSTYEVLTNGAARAIRSVVTFARRDHKSAAELLVDTQAALPGAVSERYTQLHAYSTR